MKKIAVVLLVLCCAASLFAGGSGESGTTLKVWHIWASDTESSKIPFLNAVKAYQDAHPNIKLEVDATENEAYKTKIRSAIAAGEAPDVFFHWSGGTMKPIVDAGAVLPLDRYLDSNTKSRMLPGTTVNATFNNVVYGLPYTQDVGTFFVNQELFDRNNLKVPTTWDELINVCQVFLSRGITPFTIGAKETWCIAMYFEVIYLKQAGFQATNDALSKKISFNNADTIEAARKLQQLIDMGAFGQGAMGISRDESEVPFYEGKVPMYINGSWTIGNVNRYPAIKPKIKIYPFPVLGSKGSLRDLTGGTSGAFMVSSKTKYQAEAAEFVKFVTERFSTELYKIGAGNPTWKANIDESALDPLTKNLSDVFRSTDTYTLWWDTLLEPEDAQFYLDNLSRLFAKQMTPQQFATALGTLRK